MEEDVNSNWHKAYAQFREAIHSTFVIVDGIVQKDHGAINVVAAQVGAI